MNKIAVFIVDDHRFIIEGIKITLAGLDDIVVTGEAENSKELFLALEQSLPDLLLLDLTLPELSGIEIAQILREKYPSVKIIIITANTDEESVQSAIYAGAKGYLSKTAHRQELIEAIRNVAQGDDFFGEQVSKQIVKSYIRNTRTGLGTNEKKISILSDREIEIIQHIANGKSYKEIGDLLFISARTVETHKNNIMLKLELSTVADLIKFAIRHKITSL